MTVQEQHEQMVLQHSHIRYFSTHQHLLSYALSFFSFLVTNHYILPFHLFWYHIKAIYPHSLDLYYQTICHFRTPDFYSCESRGRPSASSKIYNSTCKNSLPF